MQLRDKIFSEEKMYMRLKKASEEEGLKDFGRALDYARKMHSGMVRKSSKFNNETVIPYIIHPLMMACHAHALGIRDDKVLTVIMLHDICEDCGIEPEELPFTEEIQMCVDRLTKRKGQDTGEYFSRIEKDPTAAIVKALDRVNNVSTMCTAFPREKEISYLEETEKYVYPLLDVIKYEYNEYNDAVFILKYHLRSLIETIKCLMME